MGERPRYEAHSHCSYCGAPFPPQQPWPRHCARCGNVSFRNPIPVTIVLVPVGSGVLAVRRNIEPRRGWWALPGGYVDWGETWQEAGAREVYEEAGVTIDPATMEPVTVFSAPDGTLVICGQVPPLPATDLPPFEPSQEVSERTILTEPVEMAFPLHTRLVADYLARIRAGRSGGEAS
ncbi:NUDIX domain-containing protein [Litorilinea aerophila]|uniref:NUDIX domain-containing protein n=1 Tax=Litorilinea aerophila TaxID=1204385 RepID=A0A540VL30_9CHLR|nr:NUDIX domain-containing protein [Litorilinea aerophila]MCC9075164.1 NUDIX domain-containing protein [Litorilinea aerophila]GIV78168.1 MAG: NUDIX hydrolase [Litorilinea sp.]